MLKKSVLLLAIIGAVSIFAITALAQRKKTVDAGEGVMGGGSPTSRQDTFATELPQPRKSRTPKVPRPPRESESKFDVLSNDLVLMRDLFQGGGDQQVTFDADTARKRGFSPASIKLAEELATHTNELIFAASTADNKDAVDVTKMDSDVEQFPALTSYLNDATERRKKVSVSEETPEAKDPDSEASVVTAIAEYYCGSFSRPRPSKAAPSKNHNSNNPASTLRSWGYHETPSWAGGAWTRPQTYNPLLCGWQTYRDHAWISGPKKITEQNYARSTPNGEPNPEVWRSGPWPYAYWPVYVRWWHSRY